MPKVVFVGAGPGDPELVTLKGKRYLEEADCVIYAGSLVNPDILAFAPPDALRVDSSRMSLEALVDLMAKEAMAGKRVVRLHSGDPTLFGAIQEQITALHRLGIEVEVVPGVSSVFAASAYLRREYTLPGVSQTLIITRFPGRTPVPERERLRDLARHRTSLALLLSAALGEEVERELCSVLPPTTPCAVVYHVGWPDACAVEGEIRELSEMLKRHRITRSAVILVGDFLKGEGQRSYLYRGERE